jgi:hypothetical protein
MGETRQLYLIMSKLITSHQKEYAKISTIPKFVATFPVLPSIIFVYVYYSLRYLNENYDRIEYWDDDNHDLLLDTMREFVQVSKPYICAISTILWFGFLRNEILQQR